MKTNGWRSWINRRGCFPFTEKQGKIRSATSLAGNFRPRRGRLSCIVWTCTHRDCSWWRKRSTPTVHCKRLLPSGRWKNAMWQCSTARWRRTKAKFVCLCVLIWTAVRCKWSIMRMGKKPSRAIACWRDRRAQRGWNLSRLRDGRISCASMLRISPA